MRIHTRHPELELSVRHRLLFLRLGALEVFWGIGGALGGVTVGRPPSLP